MSDSTSLRNEQIKTLFIQRFSYEKIGELFNISKVRARQIISDYLIEDYSKQTTELALFKYNKNCNLCGLDKVTNLHYIDKNPKNIDRGNILPLCEPCYKLFNQNLTISSSNGST